MISYQKNFSMKSISGFLVVLFFYAGILVFRPPESFAQTMSNNYVVQSGNIKKFTFIIANGLKYDTNSLATLIGDTITFPVNSQRDRIKIHVDSLMKIIEVPENKELKGAAIGFAVGGSIGMIIGRIIYNHPDENHPEGSWEEWGSQQAELREAAGTLMGGAIGALAGGITGLIIGSNMSKNIEYDLTEVSLEHKQEFNKQNVVIQWK